MYWAQLSQQPMICQRAYSLTSKIAARRHELKGADPFRSTGSAQASSPAPMPLSPSRTRLPNGFSFCLPSPHPQGLGEAGMFLGSSVFFAIAAAVDAARKERGLSQIWAINSPATAELIRMACEDQFTNLVWDDLHLVNECVQPLW